MRLSTLAMIALISSSGRMSGAQTADSTRNAATGAIRGIVRDTIAHRALANAIVQLAGADPRSAFARATMSDAMGAYVLANIPDGRYILGFLHPTLDSLGLRSALREVTVVSGKSLSVELSSPSPALFRAALCGQQSPVNQPSTLDGMIVGTVLNARNSSPATFATVTAEWSEMTFTAKGVLQRRPIVAAKAGSSGWFVLCHLPTSGQMLLLARQGADSTDRIEVPMPSEGFVRLDLYVGWERTGDASSKRDSARAENIPQMPVDEVLSGTVFAADGGKPITGAQISLSGGSPTRSNDRGEWTIANAQIGTRTLDVRAIGFYPEHRRVNVVPGGTSVRVGLSTFKAVLDTARVNAVYGPDRRINGFESRRRSGAGHYMTQTEINKQKPIVTSDIIRRFPGMHFDRTNNPADGTMIQMRGTFEDQCSVEFYVNGRHVGALNAEDLDQIVQPRDVLGIEMYSATSVPPQFSEGMIGKSCGAVVIWTK